MGRDKAKVKGKGKASDSNELTEMGVDMKGIKDRIDKILQIASERELWKQKESDMRVLAVDTSNMTGDELQVILAMKEEVKKHYSNPSLTTFAASHTGDPSPISAPDIRSPAPAPATDFSFYDTWIVCSSSSPSQRGVSNSMVEIISIVVIITTLLLVRILYVISHSSKPICNTSSKHLSTLIVLGSGGHTAEMINLLSVMQNDRFAPRFYIAAVTDNMSLQKARVFENTLADKISLQVSDSTKFMQIYRSREVGQSYITSIGTTLFALCHALWLMLKIRPQVILCNGPGTCIPLCAIAFIFKVLGIRWSYIFYVESIARVKRLSLSGLLLYKLHMADQLFVQWPQLQKQYPRAHYVGRLM
ncbi:unnamed protein product [Lactuca virosa]|uniref:UDP-N-acetylglucosamine transferase subunit ALG14 n=1 Tax=Lactuca virosa TaxID=75947 RepID=A0AAU9P8U8_9ASTR|nr:unnamed protein product [Lactuca virosa]